jgi:hypothetical protein
MKRQRVLYPLPFLIQKFTETHDFGALHRGLCGRFGRPQKVVIEIVVHVENRYCRLCGHGSRVCDFLLSINAAVLRREIN